MSVREYLMQCLNLAPAPKPARTVKPYERPIADRDFVAALPLLTEACAQDDADAMTLLASFYYEGCVVEKSYEEAALWYRQAAVRGNLDAQAALGSMLAEGLGTSPNPFEAAYWLFQSARNGHSTALDWLSNLVLQVPEAAGDHFSLEDLAALHKKRGLRVMLGATA